MKKVACIAAAVPAGATPCTSPMRGITRAPVMNHAPAAKANDVSATRLRFSTTRRIKAATAA
jgi:hypothetical protein